MTTQHPAAEFTILCTALILLCCAVPAQAQSEIPADEQTANVPVEWFRLLPDQAGGTMLVVAKRELSEAEAGVEAIYFVQRNDRPEVFRLAIVPYGDALRNRVAQLQPMDTERLPEGMEAFIDGERRAVALNKQMGYAALVETVGPGASDRTLSDALMHLPISVMERADNEAAQMADSSVDTSIAPLLAALPFRMSRLELMGVEMDEPGTSQLELALGLPPD